jgi:hypothetical protein
MPEGDYSPSEFDDEQPSAVPHVDLEQVVEVINDLLGADYSAKYCVSSFIKYNAEKYAPATSMKDKGQTRSDSKQFDKSKGYGSNHFCQAVFGFAKSITPTVPNSVRVVLGSRATFSRCSRSRRDGLEETNEERSLHLAVLAESRKGAHEAAWSSLAPRQEAEGGRRQVPPLHLNHEDKEGFSESIKFQR